jgi:hypothetical protein
MLVSVVRGCIQERTQNFGHLHETCPRNCVWSVFKFYKKQTKSENHETYWDVVISYVEAMIKISEDFVHVVTYDAYKPRHLYMLTNRRSWVRVLATVPVCLHHVVSPLHRPAMAPLAWLHRHPRYNPSFHIIVVDRVTQLGVSRSKEIRLEVCRSLHIYDRIYFGLSTLFGQPVDA